MRWVALAVTRGHPCTLRKQNCQQTPLGALWANFYSRSYGVEWFVQWCLLWLWGGGSWDCRLIEAQSWHAWFLKGLNFRLTFSKIKTSFLQKSRVGRLELLYSNLLHSTWGNWIALNNVFINAFQRRMDWSTKVKLALLSTLLQSYNQVTGTPSLI